MFFPALFIFEAKCRRCKTNCILFQMSLFGLCLVIHLRKACTLTINFFHPSRKFYEQRSFVILLNYIRMVENCYGLRSQCILPFSICGNSLECTVDVI